MVVLVHSHFLYDKYNVGCIGIFGQIKKIHRCSCFFTSASVGGFTYDYLVKHPGCWQQIETIADIHPPAHSHQDVWTIVLHGLDL